MIQINDNDLPIMVAEKIINGVRPYNPTACVKALAKVLTDDDIEEIKEIADYLMVHYQAHQNGD